MPFSQTYRTALVAYISRGGERERERAYELGRLAFDCKYGLLNLLLLHQGIVSSILDKSGDTLHHVQAAHEFLMEAISPFEMAYLAYAEFVQPMTVVTRHRRRYRSGPPGARPSSLRP